MPEPLTDADLASMLDRIAQGDKAVMRSCVEHLGGLVWTMARRQLGEQDAEEVVQDTFLALWQDARRFNPQTGRAVTFISVIARRRIIDRIRKNTRQPATQLLQPDDDTNESPRESTPGLLSEHLENLARTLKTLPREQQSALRAVYYKGLTHAEAATALSLPLGTLKTAIRRSLQSIRQKFPSGNP